MPTNLDNDKEELKLKSQLINALQVFDLLPHEQDSKYGSGKANKEDYWRICNKAIDQYTQSKLKAFAGEFEKAIGKDDRDYSQDNTDLASKIALVASSAACNELRVELRQALKAIKGKYQL